MLVKILGILDLISALIFFINNNFDKLDTWFPNNLVLIVGLYLLLKGIFFLIFMDFASILDIICGTIVLLSLSLQIPAIFAAIVTLFLIQKAIFSLVS